MTNSSPLISRSQLAEVLELLLCHALHNNLPDLTSKLTDTFPEILNNSASSPYRQLVIFSAFFSKFRRVGPLPYVCKLKFLNTLHDGVTGMFRHNSEALKPMPINDVIKLVSGLRLMLGKALLLEESIVPKDIETFIKKYFPVLPVTADSVQAWQSLGEILHFDVKQSNNPDMKTISAVNNSSVNFLNKRLHNLQQERLRSRADIESSFLTLWRGGIEDKMISFMEKTELFLNKSTLENLTENDNVKLKLLISGLPRRPSEKDLIALVDHLQNVFIESQFWASDIVQSALAGQNAL